MKEPPFLAVLTVLSVCWADDSSGLTKELIGEPVMELGHPFSLLSLAPATGLEPVTYWLTANRSTTELRGNTHRIILIFIEVVKLQVLLLLAKGVNRARQLGSRLATL